MTMHRFSFCAAASLGALLIACGDGAPRTAADSQAAHVQAVVSAGGVVDSILPIAEQLRRFREGMTPVDSLTHAETSREALVTRWLRAVAESDTATLNTLVLDRAEFAFLYYPSSAMSLPPYEAPPQLLWGQILASSNEGLPKVLARFAGTSVALERLDCPDSVTAEGDNRLSSNCTVTVRAGSAVPVTARLFGTILERQGRFKFIGYANSL